MKILVIVATIFMAVNVGTAAVPIDWKLVHERTDAALHYLYDLDFRKAESVSNEVIAIAPNDPRGHFVKAMVYYYRMSFKGTRNDTAFGGFLYHAAKVEKVCDELLEQNENDTKAMFYMGGIIGFKGLTYFSRGENMKAVWDGKKGYTLLVDALELTPDNHDAKMGLGLFRYLISQAPESIRPLLKAAGAEGDRAGGLRMLEEAAAKGTYARWEARRWLADFYQDEDMPVRAASHLDVLAREFPNNWYIQRELADVRLYQLRQPDKAEAIYRRLLEMPILEYDTEQVRYSVRMRLAYADMIRERYAQARAWAEQARDKAPSAKLKEEAVKQIEAIDNLSGDPIQRVSNAVAAGAWMRTNVLADSLRALPRGFLSQKNDAYAWYLQGAAYTELQNYGQAEECLRMALGKPEKEPWLEAYCCYRLGMVQARRGKASEATTWFQKAAGFSDYSGERTLRLRLARERAALKKATD